MFNHKNDVVLRHIFLFVTFEKLLYYFLKKITEGNSLQY